MENSIDMKEQLREVRRQAERECERLQEQMEAQSRYLQFLEQYDALWERIEQLEQEVADRDEQLADKDRLLADKDRLLDEKDMKLKELGKFSVGMAKKSSQEGLEKAFRIYINTSKRKTQAKREVAKAQLLDFIATAKLEMPEDIMELLNQLDDEQPEVANVVHIDQMAIGDHAIMKHDKEG